VEISLYHKMEISLGGQMSLNDFSAIMVIGINLFGVFLLLNRLYST